MSASNTPRRGASRTHRRSGGAEVTRELERVRTQFRGLILANPNYFGNLKDSPFKPVFPIQLNTFYEEIGCVGFQPQFNRLEAVVFVNQPSGYGGDICSSGTPEYVRFYLSFDNGATWQDQGLTSFIAHDIPEGTSDDRRLEYAVSMEVSPPRTFCFISNLVLARAILSWNVPPPPNDPDFPPVWGDVHNTHIQVEPRRLFPFKDIFEVAKLELPPELLATLDLEQTVAAAEPAPLSVAELQQQYADKDVPVQRFAFGEVQRLIDQPALSETLLAPGFPGIFGELDIDLSDIIVDWFPTDGDTSYEELECVGLNPNLDTLSGVIRVKKPFGYSGGPCSAGSREYVTFWGDFDGDGSFETCLGTTSVRVRDYQDIPDEGLEYAVFLPVDLSQYRQPCEQGAVVVPIRAILSWQNPAPCWNPNHIPRWGNREDTLIHIKPGFVSPPGTHPPIIETVGSMDVFLINSATGLANGPSALVGFTAVDSPFGGEVVIRGRLLNPPDISSGATNLKYQVLVRRVGDPWQRLTNTFGLQRSQILDGIPSSLPAILQAVDVDDFYTYHEDVTNGPGNALISTNGVLARWQTGGLSGLWQIAIVAKDPVTNTLFPGPQIVTVRLDNQAPQFPANSFTITTGGGACADFTIGDVISGMYAVTDEHFGSLSLSILPANGGAFTSPAPYPGVGTMPLVRRYSPVAPPGVPTTGESGNWSLDTAGLPRCGYVVVLRAADRTIVNSGFVGFSSETVVGLCLRAPGE
jgi:hypothetical protein